MASALRPTGEFAVRAVQATTGNTLYALANRSLQDETISLVFQTSAQPLPTVSNIWAREDYFPAPEITPTADPNDLQMTGVELLTTEDRLAKKVQIDIHLPSLDDPPAIGIIIALFKKTTTQFPHLIPAISSMYVHTPSEHYKVNNPFILLDSNQQIILSGSNNQVITLKLKEPTPKEPIV